MLDKLDFTRHPYSKLIKKISVYDYSPNVIGGMAATENEATEIASNLYSSANPPKNF